MVKSLLVPFACLMQLACYHGGKANNSESIAAGEVAKAPVLWTADYSPDGKFYAVGGNDSLLKVYDANDHKLLHSFKLPASVQFLDWHKDSQVAGNFYS
jgi:WD40 repeat protein